MTDSPSNATSNFPAPPPPPPGTSALPPNAPTKPKKPINKKLIIWSVVIVVVVALGLTAFFVIQSFLKGGKSSPEELGSSIVEAVNTKDVMALGLLVAPEERDVVLRLQERILDTIDDPAIEEARNAIENPASEGTELNLDGIEIAVSGVTPTVEELSEDVALLKFAAGEISTTVKPTELSSGVKTMIESTGGDPSTMEESTNKAFLAELGPNNSGITLVATKSDGRWFLSPLLSATDSATSWAVYDDSYGDLTNFRGFPSDELDGADNPEEAAAQAVRSFADSMNTRSFGPISTSLARTESLALQLYGNAWADLGFWSGVPSVQLGATEFEAGNSSGNAAVVHAKNVSMKFDDDLISFSGNCATDDQGESICADEQNLSFLDDGFSSLFPAVLTIDGKFGLSTIKEDGKWKVSALNTVADMGTGWMSSLSGEEKVRLMGLEAGTKQTGAAAVGKETKVGTNTVGVATVGVEVDEEQLLDLNTEQSLTGAKLYNVAESGKVINSSYVCDLSYDHCAVPAGKYVLVIDALGEIIDSDQKGDQASLPVSFTLAEYFEPGTINGDTNPVEINYSWGYYSSVEVFLPEKSPQKLFLTFSDPSKVPGILEVGLDGQTLKVDGRKNAKTEIPLPDTGYAHLSFDIDSDDDSNWRDVAPTLSFER
ncbi:hypothetical protein ACTXJU_15055 [Glutamicibacter ardleyensis]|uniref:hypothetical protein n=1 Tax=Glutamicibacter ardleyensis TaxID=225894 RepID=UPI003FD12D18